MTPKPPTRLAPLIRLLTHVSPKRRRQFGGLLAITLAGSIAEIVSLAAVVPFIAVLTRPDRLFDYQAAVWFSGVVGIERPESLLLPLTAAFALAAVGAGAIRLLLLTTSIKLGNAAGADLGVEAYRRTLYQPYEVHVLRNSGEIISGITQKVGAATGVLTSLVTVMTSAALFVAILVTLLLIDPLSAMIATAMFGVAYAAIAWRTRHRLRSNGQCIAREQTAVVRSLQEGLGAIRDILLDGSQPVYAAAYERSARSLLQASGDNAFINQAPRFVMETLALVAVAVLAYVASLRSGGVADLMPTLGALGLGAQRLLPLLQLLYGHWSVIAGSQAALVDVVALLEQPLPESALGPPPAPLPLTKEIRLEHVRFRYEGSEAWVLDDVHLTIPKGSRIGFAGLTGGGKSTLLDVVMGLLDPVSGSVSVDGVVIRGAHRRAWQRAVAHVPQAVYLSDASIAENIAFGVPTTEIDHVRVAEAASRAMLTEFIDACPNRFDTQVGERGTRLSGGQRQRLGIARALYRRASVLVLDEATSALDSSTEEAVMTAIAALDRSLTILMVAHRQSTLDYCDVVYRVAHGRLEGPS
jgi:ATP-binding cassette, subfamily B, bacterial PglK